MKKLLRNWARSIGLWVLPKLLTFWLRFVIRTSSIHIIGFHEADAVAKNHGVIWCVWHGYFAPLIHIGALHWKPLSVIVSPSQDGELLHRILTSFGYGTIRGDHRRFVFSTIKTTKTLLQSKTHVIFAADGPLGPRFCMKPGAVHLSMLTGSPIVLAVGMSTRGIIFHKAWDRFQLPLPFGKIWLAFDGPIFLSKDLHTDQAKENERQLLEDRLNRLYQIVESKVHPFH